MSDFGKGVAVGWLTSGNGNSGSGGNSDGEGCLGMFMALLYVIAFLAIGFVILFIVSFFLVLKDMGTIWYVGLPFIFGLWDLYVPWELAEGQKLWMLTATIVFYTMMYKWYDNHLQYYMGADDRPRQFKIIRNFMLNMLAIVYTVLLILGGLGYLMLVPRIVYYLFVVIF